MSNTEILTAKQTKMRRFVLDRAEDATGTSGTGAVAEGVTVLEWPGSDSLDLSIGIGECLWQYGCPRTTTW